jgi:hypothetical protein
VVEFQVSLLTFLLAFLPSAVTNKEKTKSTSEIAKIQVTTDGRGVRNAARKTGGDESVFILSLTRV